MVVIHCADIHIGKNRKYPDYLQHQKVILKSLIAKVREKLESTPDGEPVWFVVAGDIFDRRDVKAEEYFVFLVDFVSPLMALIDVYQNFEIYVIDGNHDRKDTPDNPSLLTPILGVLPNRFYLDLVNPKYHEHSKVLSVPFGGYNQDSFSKLVDTYRPKYVIAHECFAGIRTDIGYEKPRNQDKYIEADNLQSYVNAFFLGDIHRYQKLGTNCWYSGSPVTLDFSAALPKGVLVYNIEGDTVEEPVLEPLDGDIRVHKDLGTLEDVSEIPWDSCYGYKNNYLKLEGTPEIYKAISDKISDFFPCPLVTWEFAKRKSKELTLELEKSESNNADGTETTVIVNPYYNDLVQQWIVEKLPQLIREDQEECYKRLSKIFETRG